MTPRPLIFVPPRAARQCLCHPEKGLGTADTAPGWSGHGQGPECAPPPRLCLAAPSPPTGETAAVQALAPAPELWSQEEWGQELRPLFCILRCQKPTRTAFMFSFLLWGLHLEGCLFSQISQMGFILKIIKGNAISACSCCLRKQKLFKSWVQLLTGCLI